MNKINSPTPQSSQDLTTFSNYSNQSDCFTMKFLISVLHFLFFFGIFFYIQGPKPSGPKQLFIFGKSSHLHCFLRNKYKKNPTCTPLLKSTCLKFLKFPPTYTTGFRSPSYQDLQSIWKLKQQQTNFSFVKKSWKFVVRFRTRETMSWI